MKKIILIISLIFGVFVLNAQVKTDAVKLNGGVGDTIIASATKYSTVVNVNSSYATTYDWTVRMDSVSGAPNVTVTRQWSNDQSNWVDIDTVTWAGTSSDTSWSYAAQTQKGQYNRLKYVGSATTQKSKFKSYFKNWYSVTPK